MVEFGTTHRDAFLIIRLVNFAESGVFLRELRLRWRWRQWDARVRSFKFKLVWALRETSSAKVTVCLVSAAAPSFSDSVVDGTALPFEKCFLAMVTVWALPATCGRHWEESALSISPAAPVGKLAEPFSWKTLVCMFFAWFCFLGCREYWTKSGNKAFPAGGGEGGFCSTWGMKLWHCHLEDF